MKKIVIFLLCIIFGYSSYLIIKNKKNKDMQLKATQSTLYVINVLDKEAYDDAHITGSIHIPYNQVRSFLKTITDKNTWLIFYCSNYYCTASDNAASQAYELGFRNIFVYQGGMAEWFQNAQHNSSYAYQGPARLDYLKFVIVPDTQVADDTFYNDETKVEKKFTIISANNLQKILKEGKL